MPGPEQPTIAERIAALPPAKLFRFEDLARRKVDELIAKHDAHRAWADKIEDDISSTPDDFKPTAANGIKEVTIEAVNKLSQRYNEPAVGVYDPSHIIRNIPRPDHIANRGLIPQDLYNQVYWELTLTTAKAHHEPAFPPDKTWIFGQEEFQYAGTIYFGVHIAQNKKDGRLVVIKEKVDINEMDNLTKAEDYQKENLDLQVNGNFVSPRIIPHGTMQENNKMFYAMEVAEGISLSKILDLDYTIPVEDSLTIASSMLSVFQMVHENFGTTYRDWKPYEVIWDPKRRVAKTVDWEGLTPKDAFEEMSNISGALQEGEWLKVAAILYMLVAGRQYSFDKSYHEQIAPDVINNPDARLLLAKALNPDYEKRYHSAKEFRTDVKMVLERVGRGIPTAIPRPAEVTIPKSVEITPIRETEGQKEIKYFTIESAFESHIGLKRLPPNQDYARINDATITPEKYAAEGFVYVVADGMGGLKEGEVASEVGTIEFIANYMAYNSDDRREAIKHALQKANEAVYKEDPTNPGKTIRGATFVAAIVMGEDLYIVSAGDSRGYLYRSSDHSFTRLTDDHSWVSEIERIPEALQEFQERHRLLQPLNRNHMRYYLGQQSLGDDLDKFIKGPFRLEEGDRILLCSDGLWERVEEDVIRNRTASNMAPSNIAQALIGEALRRGGQDNVTALVAEMKKLNTYKPSETNNVSAPEQENSEISGHARRIQEYSHQSGLNLADAQRVAIHASQKQIPLDQARRELSL